MKKTIPAINYVSMDMDYLCRVFRKKSTTDDDKQKLRIQMNRIVDKIHERADRNLDRYRALYEKHRHIANQPNNTDEELDLFVKVADRYRGHLKFMTALGVR